MSQLAAFNLAICAEKSLESGVNRPMSVYWKPALMNPGGKPRSMLESATPSGSFDQTPPTCLLVSMEPQSPVKVWTTCPAPQKK